MVMESMRNLKSHNTVVALIALVPLLLTLLVYSLAASVTILARASEEAGKFYPCINCHRAMDLTGQRKSVKLHDINLTLGAHRGLYCSNCHVPPIMQELLGGSEVYIPGLHSRDQLMETNKVCAVCHPREYKDYELLVHANKTLICNEGESVKLIGYKGVDYVFHICPDYTNLSTVPAKACVECHNPHDPLMPPPNILPEPSTRPPPPREDSIALGGLAAVLGGIILIVSAFAVPRRRRGALEVVVNEG